MESERVSTKKRVFSFFIMALLVISAIAVSVYFMKNKPRAKRVKAKVLAPLVNTQKLQIIDHNVTISALGIVKASQSVELSAQISGEIIEVRENLAPGTLLKRGDFIAKIEPRDFELMLRQKEAELIKAQSELALEEGQVAVAAREYQLLGEAVDIQNRDLILRKPHLRAAQFKVNSAYAAYELAKLNLERTDIKAPFNAIIQTRDVSVGTQIRSSNRVVTLAGSDSYWIETTVNTGELAWIDFGKGGSKARVKTQSIHAEYPVGNVISRMSDVEKNGRMARVIVEVKNPLKFALLLNDIVDVEIFGKSMKGVKKIPRVALHNGNTIWLLSPDNRLKIVNIMPLWTQKDSIYIAADMVGTEYELIISGIPSPVSGMKLRTK